MVVNETLNQTLHATLNQTNASGLGSALAGATNGTLVAAQKLAAAQSFVPLVFLRLWDLIAAPFRNGEMLWIIFPLFFTFFVMEFYYDRNKDEELGWGAALANSLILIFVAIDLIKTSFNYATPWSVLRSVALAVFSNGVLDVEPQVVLLIVFLAILGVAVTLINYFHLLPRRMMFVVSGHPPINFLAYFAIVIVYSTHTENPVPFDMATLVAGAMLFVIICVIVFGIKKLLQRMWGDNQQMRWNNR